MAIFIPLIKSVLQKDEIVSEHEKRNLAQWPSFPQTIQQWKVYPEKISTYYTDQFGHRESLVKRYFRLIQRFDSSIDDDVFPGKDGWYFLGEITPGYWKHDDPIGDAMNVNLYTDSELALFAQSITEVQKWLAEQGIEYIYMIAPNKHTIYFDKMPDYIRKVNNESAMDQLYSYLKQHTSVHLLDLRPALMKAKSSKQVYFKTDTHWNTFGANIAQYELLTLIEQLFPGEVSARLKPDEEIEQEQTSVRDLAKMLSLTSLHEIDPQPVFDNKHESKCDADVSYEGNWVEKTQVLYCKEKTLNAIVFRDSFFEAMIPYFSRQMKTTVSNWDQLTYQALVTQIEEINPDIVIEELVERRLPYVHEGLNPDKKPGLKTVLPKPTHSN